MKIKILSVLLFLASIMYAQIPTTGLKAYYQLDNSSTADLLGLDNLVQTGTATVATTNKFGASDTAVTLNGDSFSRGNITYGTAYNDFSISFWVKTTTNTTDSKAIIYDIGNPSGYAGSTNVGSYVYLANGKITLRLTSYLGANGPINNLISSDFIADGNWHHITVISDQLKPTIYTDNVLTAQGGNNNAPAFTNRLADPITDIFIAQNSANSLSAINQYQDGLDNIAFYDRVLTAAEIEGIGNNNGFCFPPIDADLAATNVTETSADINWINSGTYDIAYGLFSDNFTTYTQVNGITGSSYALTNLTASSAYTVYIRQQCSATQNSDWNTFNFATEGPAYVDVNATGNNTGSSFADAYTDLNTALTNHPGKEIWIAQGTYIPTQSGVTDRSYSFDIPVETKLYGGFDGTETMLSERDFRTNITILSGDINGDDDGVLQHNNALYSDNSYRVVTISGDDVVLDGLTIKGGNANDASDGANRVGSALYFNQTAVALTFNHLIIEDNRASDAGTVYVNSTANSTLNHNYDFESCIFRNNIARFATIVYVASPYTIGTHHTNFTNSLFYGNEARDEGTNTGSNTLFWFRNDSNRSNIAIFENCTITKNRFFGTNTQATGVISSSKNSASNGQSVVGIYNSIIWDNLVLNLSEQVSLDRFGTQQFPSTVVIKNSLGADGFSNWSPQSSIATNPLFTNVATNDFTLQTTSSAIDSGDNTLIVAALDLAGNNRVFNTTVDMGAYEFGSSVPVDRTLTTSAMNGTITVDIAPTNGVYTDGTLVELTATAATGYVFDGWSGDATGTTNPLSVTMDADKNITALFSLVQRTLTTIAINGTITANTASTNGTYDNGTLLVLTATPDAGYQFDGWSGDASGTTNPLNITMDADKSITAVFSIIQRVLTTNAVNGVITINTSPNSLVGNDWAYNDGRTVELIAVPDNGYQFDGWGGDASGTTNPLSVTMDADKNITANYSLISVQRTLTITLLDGPVGGVSPGTVTRDTNPVNGTYNNGTVVELTAVPGVGYQFDSWSGDLSGATNPISITMDADKSVTPLFSAIATASVVDNEFDMAIKAYPNPVLNILKIDLATGQELSKVQVFNLLGKKVIETTVNTVDFSSISSGIYILKIENSRGKIATRKVIKE